MAIQRYISFFRIHDDVTEEQARGAHDAFTRLRPQYDGVLSWRAEWAIPVETERVLVLDLSFERPTFYKTCRDSADFRAVMETMSSMSEPWVVNYQIDSGR